MISMIRKIANTVPTVATQMMAVRWDAVSVVIAGTVVVVFGVRSGVAYSRDAVSDRMSSSARRHMLHRPYDILTTKAPMWLGNWLQLKWHNNPRQLLWWVALVAQWGWMH